MKDTKGPAHEKRVWTLFERAGFHTKPNTSDTAQHAVILPGGKKKDVDLLAEDPGLKVRLLGQHTISKDLPGGFSSYAADLKALMDVDGAKAGLHVLPKHPTSETDRALAKTKGIVVWNTPELEYYEALVNAIGEHAKYEIIRDLGVVTSEQKHIHQTLALRLRQPFSDPPGVALYLFTMRAEKLLKTCSVLRRIQGHASGYQRMVKKKRLLKVASFLAEERPLLPTNVIVHMNDAVDCERVEVPSKKRGGKGRTISYSDEDDYEPVLLKIPMAYASMELIDGQHRLYGFAHAEDSRTTEEYNLVVLGVQDLSDEERKSTFVAINDRSRRVDANLVAALKHTEDEAKCQADPELMAIKVVWDLNKKSPFKDRVRLFDVGRHRITLKGFSGYDLRGLLGPRGQLRKRYPRNRSKDYVGALRNYFGALKGVFPQEWKDPDRYVVFTNKGVSAFLKLLRTILAGTEAQIDAKVVKRYFLTLKREWQESWETANIKAYVGSQGWTRFYRDMLAIIVEQHPELDLKKKKEEAKRKREEEKKKAKQKKAKNKKKKKAKKKRKKKRRRR